MCKQKAVLETIKQMKGRGSMSAAQIKLAEAQCEDYQELKKEILEIKNDVADNKKDNAEIKVIISSVVAKLDLLIQQNENRPLLKILSDLKDNRYFWFWIIFLTAVLCGVNMSEIIAFFTKGN